MLVSSVAGYAFLWNAQGIDQMVLVSEYFTSLKTGNSCALSGTMQWEWGAHAPWPVVFRTLAEQEGAWAPRNELNRAALYLLQFVRALRSLPR